MVGQDRQVVETAGKAHERAAEILEELLSAASADRVFSEPVVAGDNTVITAAEVCTGMGFGYGLSVGDTAAAGRMANGDASASAASQGERESEDGRGGPRSGGGGGGRAFGRPVAVITIDPDGVTVQPVLDRTRIALTALTAAGAIGFLLIRMRRAGRR